MKGIPFLKVEGGGNDFVLLDARRRPVALSRKRIRELLDRHRGVGGDGLILLVRGARNGRPHARFWNPDGGSAAYCGNGARCTAEVLLAAREETGFSFGRYALRARRGQGGPEILTPWPRLLPTPAARPPSVPLRRGASPIWIDAGVPHWILPVSGVLRYDLARHAPGLRTWHGFGPRGTNVDAVEIVAGRVHVRTWERGVEGETQACGSGILAAAVWAMRERKDEHRAVELLSGGGDRFRALPEAPGKSLWLAGPARIVFRGEIA